VEIVDRDGNPQPPTTVGQIRINSPRRAKILKGRDSKAGSDFFIGDWYYPGDLGLIDMDGYLKLLGRDSEVIIRGGLNVFPQEVEAALSDIPGVKQVAAVGYPDERNGEEIALFATVNPGVSVEELQKHCRDRLGPAKRPKRILIIPEMPLDANGKVRRKKLCQMIS
jgi:acyl-CoA synthetase (AMP-forming)/AMP-acid ligase II